jgi:hypothetical protein
MREGWGEMTYGRRSRELSGRAAVGGDRSLDRRSMYLAVAAVIPLATALLLLLKP